MQQCNTHPRNNGFGRTTNDSTKEPIPGSRVRLVNEHSFVVTKQRSVEGPRNREEDVVWKSYSFRVEDWEAPVAKRSAKKKKGLFPIILALAHDKFKKWACEFHFTSRVGF
jgi:hypothetical protein